MNRLPKWQKEVVICAAAVLAAVAWIPSTSLAEAPAVVTVSPSVTRDRATEDSVSDLDTVQLPPIAASLTTTVGAWYQPQASLLGHLNQQLFSGLNSQNATQILPVTKGLPCDSYDPMITTIAPMLQQTYSAAISTTQQLMTQLQAEDFTTLAANVQAPAELAATQANGQVLLQIVKELQLLRAQDAATTLVLATDDLHQLDTTVRATMPRQGGGC